MNARRNETSTSDTFAVPDIELTGLMRVLPAAARPYASLARLDRPIGWWLLFWPCIYGLGLAGGLPARWDLALWMLLGGSIFGMAAHFINVIKDMEEDQVSGIQGLPQRLGTKRSVIVAITLIALGVLALYLTM